MSDWDGRPTTGWDYHQFGASICMDFLHDTLVSPPGPKTRTVSPSLPLAAALTVKSPSCLSAGLLSRALLLFSLLRSPSVSQLSDQTWDTAERLTSSSDKQPARKKRPPCINQSCHKCTMVSTERAGLPKDARHWNTSWKTRVENGWLWIRLNQIQRLFNQ